MGGVITWEVTPSACFKRVSDWVGTWGNHLGCHTKFLLLEMKQNRLLKKASKAILNAEHALSRVFIVMITGSLS